MSDGEKVLAILRKSVDIKIPDIVLWLLGEKPVIYSRQDDDLISLFASLYPKVKIFAVSTEKSHRGSPVMFISKDEGLVQAAASHLSGNPEDNIELGRLLGYPDCCVADHCEMILEKHGEGTNTFNAVKRSVETRFVLNNLLSFVTRICDPKLMGLFADYHNKNSSELNFIVRGEPLSIIDVSFISHIPCRYDCEKSLMLARKVESWLADNLPEIHAFAKQKLARPFLIFDTLNWLAFDGIVEGNVLKYTKIESPFSPVETEVKDYIKFGDKLIVDDDRIVIFSGNREIFVYEKQCSRDGYLVDFSERDDKTHSALVTPV